MFIFRRFRYKRISQNATVEILVKELVRKSIHICSALTVPLAHAAYVPTLCLLTVGLTLYIIFELMRLSGKRIPVVSTITQIASRKADEGKFVLGPVTLVIGEILSLLLFKPPISTVAIFALCFGDGFASLIGKIYGQKHFTVVADKTVAGSVACFTAVFLSVLPVLHSFDKALIITIVATFVEWLPLKNLDNIAIPLITGGTALLFYL